MKPLVFGESWTPSEFKKQFATETTPIDIIKNPHTNKVFFVCGKVTGRVSLKGYRENPCITLTTDEDSGELAYMLHNRATTNVIDSL